MYLLAGHNNYQCLGVGVCTSEVRDLGAVEDRLLMMRTTAWQDGYIRRVVMIR